MASETKRPNANKIPIALPKADAAQTSSTSLVSQEVGLQMAVGSRVRVNTAQPNAATIEGTIYTADSITNLLVLNTSPTALTTTISPTTFAAPAGSYRLIPISQIASFQILNLASPVTNGNETVKSTVAAQTNHLDTTALNTRLQRSVAAAQATLARRGPKGTAPVEQALFDGLSRMYPTRWQGTSIIISDTFILEKPYDPGNAKLLPGTHGNIDHVRKVVEREKTNAALRQPLNVKTSNNGVKSSVGDSHRKGG